jgi:putative lipoprotein
MFKHLFSGLTFALALVAMSSCDNDTPNNPTPSAAGSFLITTNVVNADGASGVSYFQSVAKMEGSIDNSQARPAGMGVPPLVIGKHIFVLPDYMGSTKSVITHYVKDQQGNIVERGTLAIPTNSGASNIVLATEEKAYLSMQNLGIVMEFNPTTMQKVRDLDLNSLAQPEVRVAPGAMVLRDGLLFVGLNQFDSQWMPHLKQAEVAIIDTKANKFLKRIVDTKHELSFATRPIDAHSIFVNPKDGAIYLNCMGSFGFKPGFDSGILRIKKGETEFDGDYVLNISQAKVPNFNHALNYLGTVRLASDGKVYAMAASYELDASSNPYLAKVMVPVCIDLENRSVAYISGVKPSNGHAVAVSEANGKIYFGVSNADDNGFYAYDLAAKKITGLALRVQGFPAQMEVLP